MITCILNAEENGDKIARSGKTTVIAFSCT